MGQSNKSFIFGMRRRIKSEMVVIVFKLSIILLGLYQFLQMPRKESLATIMPNRYYDIQATVKYFHRAEHGATAVIEQDQVQKKILLPSSSHLDQGVIYRFPKCFYSNRGWIKVKQAGLIEHIKSQNNISISLGQINQRKQSLENNYLTTSLLIVHVGLPEPKQKDGVSLTLTLLKGFSNDLMVDITLWNQQVSQKLQNKQVLLQGFRLRMLNNGTFVLVSTVYSKLTILGQSKQSMDYNPEKQYLSLSRVYEDRIIGQMKQALTQFTKCFSVIQAKIKQKTAFQYQGCSKCHTKMDETVCISCGSQSQKVTFQVCQLELEDASGTFQVYVFDSQLQGALKLTKKGSSLRAKIRSTIRPDASGEKNIESHTLTGIRAITF